MKPVPTLAHDTAKNVKHVTALTLRLNAEDAAQLDAVRKATGLSNNTEVVRYLITKGLAAHGREHGGVEQRPVCP